jgi:hypothetical protein
LFDEMLKLLQTGHALASVAQLRLLGLQSGIYPLLDVVVERADTPFVKAALIDTDRRVGEGKPVAPSFLLACVLWSDVKAGWDLRLANRIPPFPALQEAIEEEKQAGKTGAIDAPPTDYKFGTVGCVALDHAGNLAAGTSTGGMTNKRWNRLGDSPIIGAGTYASNDACAVSCTGHGEFFIRYAVAHDVWAMMAYKGLSVTEAGEAVVNKKLVEKGGEGGLIAVDKNGNIALPFKPV